MDPAVAATLEVLRAALEARPHLAPLVIGHDSPGFVLLAHPLGLRPLEAPALARLVILHPLGAVPHVLAAIDRVEEQRAQSLRELV